MTTRHVHGQGPKKPVDEKTTAYFRKQMIALFDGGALMDKYHTVENIGNITIIPKNRAQDYVERTVNSIIGDLNLPSDKPEDNENFDLNIRIKKIKSYVNDEIEFGKKLGAMTKRILEDLKNEMDGFFSGNMNFEKAYVKQGGRIFVIEYRFRARMKNNSKNRPIKVIMSDSEECDFDALLLSNDFTSKGFRVYTSPKRIKKNQV